MTNGNSGVTRAFSAHFDLFLSHFGFRLSTHWCRPVRNHTESDKNVGWIDSNGVSHGCCQPKVMPNTSLINFGWRGFSFNKTHLDQTCCVIASICVSTLYSTSVPSVFQHSQATHPICWNPGMKPIRGSRREHENRKPKDLPLASWGSLSDLGKAKKKLAPNVKAHALLTPKLFWIKSVMTCEIRHTPNDTWLLCLVWSCSTCIEGDKTLLRIVYLKTPKNRGLSVASQGAQKFMNSETLHVRFQQGNHIFMRFCDIGFFSNLQCGSTQGCFLLRIGLQLKQRSD